MILSQKQGVVLSRKLWFLLMQNKTRRSGLVDPIEIGSECEARCSSTNSVMHS